MAKPRLIILVRHGESQGNKDKSVNRYIPNHKVPLTEKGHEQALKAGKRLREILDPEKDSVMFYTSPYLRTRQTLEGMIEGMGEDFNIKYKINEEPRMREQDFGNFQSDSDKMEEIWLERADYGHFFYRIPYGESAADVYDRVAGFNETLFRQFSTNKFPSVLVLVTHGIWARVFLMKWFRWSVEEFEDLTNIPHCKFIIMERETVEDPDTSELTKFKYKLKTHLTTWADLENKLGSIEGNDEEEGKKEKLVECVNIELHKNKIVSNEDNPAVDDQELCENDDEFVKLEKDLMIRKNYMNRERKGKKI